MAVLGRAAHRRRARRGGLPLGRKARRTAARLLKGIASARRALAIVATIACGACASESTFRGRFFWGHEVRSFQPCGSKNAYWVRADGNTLQALRERAETLRAQQGRPYPELYIEAVGTIDAKSKREGFARNYDGVFHLRDVTGVSHLVPKDCG